MSYEKRVASRGLLTVWLRTLYLVLWPAWSIILACFCTTEWYRIKMCSSSPFLQHHHC